MRKRPYLDVHQLKKLKRELEAGAFSRFRIELCTAKDCKNPIPKEDSVEGQPKTRFCSLKCYETIHGEAE
jgi:hypothetical protein